MAGPYDLTGQNIEDTYQRILQTPDGATFYDGTGSLVNIAGSGGVTKIIAGTGINISPSTGVGNVTINSTAASYNTATGSYGSFFDTGSYLASSTTAIYSMSLSTTDISNGVYISSSDATKIKFTNAGIYNIQFSAQFTNSDNTGVDVAIWLRKNDGSSLNDLADTTGIATIPPFKAGSNGQTITSWNYFINVAAEDYIQLLWHAAVANKVTLETIAPGTNPIHPRTPCLILTAQRVDTFLSNTGSFSGSFIGTHTGSFTGLFTGSLFGTSSWAVSSSQAITASYALGGSGSFTGSLFGTSSWATNTISSSYISTLRAAGNNTEIQFNNLGVLGASSALVWNGFNIYLTTPNSNGGYLGDWSGGPLGNAAFGLFDGGGDNVIASLEANNNTYYYSNQNYSYNNNVGKHFMTGSLTVYGDITSSLFGTSSWAISSSRAITASYALGGSGSFTGSLFGTSSWAVSSSRAVTASYALNGGVTQLIAGSGITLTPSNGLGAVQIDSSGGTTIASIENINTGISSTSTEFIRAQELEQSKYTTLNIYNSLNFI